MRRIVTAIAVLGWIACGSGEKTRAPAAAQPPVVAPSPAAKPVAPPPAAAAAPAAAETPAAAPMPGAPGPADANATGCLDAVKADEFARAVPLCTAALRADPANADVKAALDQATAESAKAQAGELGKAASGAAPSLPSVPSAPKRPPY